MIVALLLYTHPCKQSLQFDFPVKNNCCQKLHLLLFVLYFIICKLIFFFYSKLVLFLMFTQAERHWGSADVAFCISGNFSLKIGDLQQNHISITMKSTSYELEYFGFHVSFEGLFCFCSVNACHVSCLHF